MPGMRPRGEIGDRGSGAGRRLLWKSDGQDLVPDEMRGVREREQQGDAL